MLVYGLVGIIEIDFKGLCIAFRMKNTFSQVMRASVCLLSTALFSWTKCKENIYCMFENKHPALFYVGYSEFSSNAACHSKTADTEQNEVQRWYNNAG